MYSLEGIAVADEEDKVERISSAISFWLSIIISMMAVYAYCISTPQDDLPTQKMRLFFRANIMDVSQFVKLPFDEQKAFASKQKHPFYTSYMDASEIEKEKIRALIHVSDDYSPNHYWLNVAFLWVIVFSTVWFICKTIEGVLAVARDRA